jgi:hypothetical protein
VIVKEVIAMVMVGTEQTGVILIEIANFKNSYYLKKVLVLISLLIKKPTQFTI